MKFSLYSMIALVCSPLVQAGYLLGSKNTTHQPYLLRPSSAPSLTPSAAIEEGLESNYQSECDVVSYLKKAGFPSSSWGTMTCIAKYESSWNCDANNKNVDGSTDYGLFEINSYYWCSGDPMSKYDECSASCSSLYDCQKNTNCAYRVYKEQGYNAWYGYQYHKTECDNYQVSC